MDDQPEFSNAYSKLVTDSKANALTGKIAYAAYKAQKIEYIINNGYKPNHDSVRNYHKDLNDRRVEELLNNANNELNSYAEFIIVDALKKEGEKAKGNAITKSILEHMDKRTSELEAEIKNLKVVILEATRFRNVLGAGVLSAFVFAIILTISIEIEWMNVFNGFKDKTDIAADKAMLSDPNKADEHLGILSSTP